MREIIFRGKDTDTGKWVYGSLLIDEGVAKIGRREQGHSSINQSYNYWVWYEVDPATVGQYTGQNAAYKDAQGQICRKQQVFEHDILADQNGEIIGCVKFTDESGWMAGVESLYDYTDRYDEKEALIIGNIHDNKDLLKGQVNE